MNYIIELVNNYGYIILFCSLVLELIALPLPGELLMTYCGFLVYESKMNLTISILVATSGVILGVTISYFVGTKLGSEFFKKYGSYIHLGPDKFEKTSAWFESYGNKLLILAYFIPGVRHITGYFSGITKISYKKFAFPAYIGAFIWTATFISLGNFLGPNWVEFHSYIKKYIIIGSLIIAFIFIIFYAYKRHKTQMIELIHKTLYRTIIAFHSLGKIRIAIAMITVAFFGFFALIIGVTQDYLAHEFEQFDTIVSSLVKAIFTKEWSYWMGLFRMLTSIKILIPLTLIMCIWIIIKNIDPFLEIRFLLIVICGGEIIQFILRNIYRRLGPPLLGSVQYTFPSNQSLISIVAFGFFAFILLRHTKRTWIGTPIIFATLLICILSGLNPLFFQTEYPSDVYAGYIFGGVWLTINIILLEIYRIMPKIQMQIQSHNIKSY
ncbi:bifunctional DedA family/phosphatase PAP2 family protein [Clostridium gasigenes]|uniref:VTT domain-containing protein n=1 Tax=Clostridium gasigenes TaxID=94869 RepID=UPI00143847F5|nr:VTT domain-containing protein [Clostridium gasigenes]NKF08696.1 membrane-associated protein [Clostridium gasigenes]QSW21205.1 bifunctional DedA family/phosphatase PAP2 family protein [Clostridium gasigenes]